MTRIAIFDMDRTLTRRGTWSPWLRHWLRHETPWRVLLTPLLLVPLARYLADRSSRGELKAAVQRVLMGPRIPGVRVCAAARTFAASVLAHEVFPAARAAIAAERACGHLVVIATASNAYYAQAIGAVLGVDHVIATNWQWQDGHLLARLAGENCYGDAKAGAVRAWLAAEGLAEASVSAWSDHASDLPLLRLAAETGGRAIAINPCAELRAEAARQGWLVLQWGKVRRSLIERA